MTITKEVLTVDPEVLQEALIEEEMKQYEHFSAEELIAMEKKLLKEILEEEV